jgi:magnesium chelatase subunit I
MKRPKTLGALRETGYTSRSVKDEIRAHLQKGIASGRPLFPGIVGYEKTVVPQLVNALLARHDIILLGLRGQAKSRILRMLVQFLDEEIPVLRDAPLNEDPLAPVSALGIRVVADQGGDAAVEWLHREARFGEKLATPDVTIADLIGDIDPVKAAREKLDFSDPDVVHYGIIPRSNRGIFAINELPDLQPRIQVGLLNILEEKDIQIRGFPVRISLDLLMVFTANPEDYTNRGNIITPLKDRIDSQIITHYPTRIEDALAITDQEAWVDRGTTVAMPAIVREVVEALAFEARKSEFVDQASGVSARVPIAALENVVSNAERRALLNGSKEARARLVDVVAALPAVTGKIELVYEGEQEGPMVVGMNLIGKAVRRVFDRHCPNPKAGDHNGQEDSPYVDVLAHFNSGHHIDLNDSDLDQVHNDKLGAIGGLSVLAKTCFEITSDADRQVAMEVILEGLHQYNMLAREATQAEFRYTDMLATMLRSDAEDA